MFLENYQFMKEDILKTKFIDITDLIQEEFTRNVDKYGLKIKCSRGCSKCCHQIFNITLVDAYIIKQHINTLQTDMRTKLYNNAERFTSTKASSNTAIEKENDLYQDLIPQPCPALDEEGGCMIYEARPIVCRRFGIPVYDYKKPEALHACELNFETGEEIIDESLIPNQTKIGLEWDKLKTEFNTIHNADIKTSTTIADAILSSFI